MDRQLHIQVILQHVRTLQSITLFDSGHGISGAALLVGQSWLAVPAMFAGGICTAFIMEYSGTNYSVSMWEPHI